MKKLITISREYGSGGREVGKIVAKRLGVPLYIKDIITMAAEESGLSPEVIESAELQAKSSFSYTLSSAVSFGEGFGGEAISMNEKLFLAQFDVITEIGAKGEGVIVGRCADYVLREDPDVTNVFIYGEKEDKIRRCIEEYGDDEATVEKKMATYDKARRNYYNYHTSRKWGEYKNYDLAINSSLVGEEGAADIICAYLEARKNNGK
ncbi:MAG: cytidylate kinase-like family protein [Eubacterium sp.]|nr:cytidylate kinase-like family protein [Eubacterium sp.]